MALSNLHPFTSPQPTICHNYETPHPQLPTLTCCYSVSRLVSCFPYCPMLPASFYYVYSFFSTAVITITLSRQHLLRIGLTVTQNPETPSLYGQLPITLLLHNTSWLSSITDTPHSLLSLTIHTSKSLPTLTHRVGSLWLEGVSQCLGSHRSVMAALMKGLDVI